MRLIEYDATDLTPEAWRSGGDARAFNPTIAEIDGGYVIAYRVVQVDSDHRRIATARLDSDLALVPGSVVALSDEITFADPHLPERSREWHADPMFLRLKGRLYLLWNDGNTRPFNHQFLAEMTDDGQHVAAPARELTTADRREVEKNWALFESDGEVYLSYTYRPHRVLRVDLDTTEPTLVATPAYTSDFPTEYERIFGVVHGGSQPVRVGDTFVTMAHSSFSLPEGRVYRGVLVEFEATAPFRVRRMSKAPFDLPNAAGAEFKHDKLNPNVHEVIYPRGLVRHGDEWIVAYGLNDEECAIAVVPAAAFASSFGPKVSTSYTLGAEDVTLSRLRRAPAVKTDGRQLPVFWFDAKGRLFDTFVGGRRFATGNFGDIASRQIAEQLSGVQARTALPGEPRLLAIGSVLHRAHDGDVVWGSGVKGEKDPLPEGIDLDVRAVRGPLSLEYLQQSGVNTDRVTHTFDPGVLFPHLYAAELAKSPSRGGDRIIPHYHDDLEMRRRLPAYSESFVSVDCTPLDMMRAIKGADRVFSSSLHGVIFAEAMGIPAYWLAPVGGENELKYYDYYYGTGRRDVKRFESLEDAMASEPMPLPTFDIEGYLSTFPHDQVARLASTSVSPGQRFDLRNWTGLRLNTFFALEGFDLRDSSGVWMTSTRAAIGTVVRAEPGDQVAITLAFTPTDRRALADSLSLRAQANGGPVQVVRWRSGGTGRVEVTLAFTATAKDTPVQLDLELEDGGPVSRRGPRDARRLARKVLPSAIAPAYRGGLLSWVRVSSVPRGSRPA
ncbi:polysaccharide pyruvyl transferase family protein [Longivirga aurantiaca]|uniref:Polysaccharide pyruvyl transferase family protein n=1 Tax=Longivirga aurantiaca TaxID=1837743 RepID=A0ABW1T6B5_9ACTN